MPVYIIKELCRTCCTCVRECTAPAIRIVGGQAELIPVVSSLTAMTRQKAPPALRSKPFCQGALNGAAKMK